MGTMTWRMETMCGIQTAFPSTGARHQQTQLHRAECSMDRLWCQCTSLDIWTHTTTHQLNINTAQSQITKHQSENDWLRYGRKRWAKVTFCQSLAKQFSQKVRLGLAMWCCSVAKLWPGYLALLFLHIQHYTNIDWHRGQYESNFPKLREYCPSAEGTRAIFP